MRVPESEPFATLPDYLAPGLRLVFVGINPSLYAVRQGHYFARRGNRFWPAFSASRLSAPVRAALGRETLGPEDDARLLDFGIGFTDVVKRPTASVADLPASAFADEVPGLLARLERARPSVACFHGITGYRAFLRHGLGDRSVARDLGPQPRSLGGIHLYVVPNPSGANAHFSLADQIAWYDRLADYLDLVAPVP